MIKWLVIVFGLAFIALFAGTLYVRLASHDPAQWHVDPTTVTEVSSDNQYRDSANVTGDRASVIARLSQVLTGEVVGGTWDSGFVTLVVRTPLYGYPDYVSVRVVEASAEMSRVTIFSRSRFGKIDFGANKKRVETILTALKASRDPAS